MLEYWLWLAERKRLKTSDALRLLEQFQTPEGVYCAPEQDYGPLVPQAALASLTDKALEPARAIVRTCREKKIHILTLQDAAYPARLKSIPDPPLVLYYQGRLPAFDETPAIAMVGTRRASVYGLVQAKRLGCQLSELGMLVISGGAAGVDTLSLKGALSSGFGAAAVFGCGVDVTYPASNRALFDDLRENGCVLSEYPPGTPPLRENFPRRNRLLSGLSMGVVVVEAPKKSGALITAQYALEQGRDVFTLPANLGSETAAGNLALLKQGAILVTDGYDVLQEYTHLFPELLSASASAPQVELSQAELRQQAQAAERAERRVAQTAQKPAAPQAEVKSPGNDTNPIDKAPQRAYIDLQEHFSELSEDERAVAHAIAQGPVQIDIAAERAGLSAGRALAALTLLEVRGLAVQLPGKVYAPAEK